jgi:hypothetical protein
MRVGRLAWVPAVLMAVGCMQGERVIRIKGDGSGTIVDTVRLGEQAKSMFAGLEQMDQTPADQKKAKKEAALKAKGTAMGLTFVSDVTTKDGADQLTWSFQDITKVKVPPFPDPPSAGDSKSDSKEEPLTFRFSKVGGHSVLTVVRPAEKAKTAATTPAKPAPKPAGKPEDDAKQIAQMKMMLAGLKMTTLVEPDGTLVKTSSPFVTGQRVTVVEIDFDKLDEKTLMKLQASGKSPDEMDPAELAGLTGIKWPKGEVTVEFQGK